MIIIFVDFYASIVFILVISPFPTILSLEYRIKVSKRRDFCPESAPLLEEGTRHKYIQVLPPYETEVSGI